jgi:hypothetical protein
MSAHARSHARTTRLQEHTDANAHATHVVLFDRLRRRPSKHVREQSVRDREYDRTHTHRSPSFLRSMSAVANALYINKNTSALRSITHKSARSHAATHRESRDRNRVSTSAPARDAAAISRTNYTHATPLSTHFDELVEGGGEYLLLLGVLVGDVVGPVRLEPDVNVALRLRRLGVVAHVPARARTHMVIRLRTSHTLRVTHSTATLFCMSNDDESNATNSSPCARARDHQRAEWRAVHTFFSHSAYSLVVGSSNFVHCDGMVTCRRWPDTHVPDARKSSTPSTLRRVVRAPTHPRISVRAHTRAHARNTPRCPRSVS